jgi:hypothetical protein
MPPVVVGGFLVLHGLITTMTGFSGVTKPDAPPLSLPSWLSWWPGPFGRSWLFDCWRLVDRRWTGLAGRAGAA